MKSIKIPNILTLIISVASKTGKSAIDYSNYLCSYKTFTLEKRKFAPRSSVRVDSQFSERLAADIYKFDVDHSLNLDGNNPNTNETYEVKATSFSNNRVRFNSEIKADHVIWIKVRQKIIEISEIDVDIYNHLDKNGFVNINVHKKLIGNKIIYTY